MAPKNVISGGSNSSKLVMYQSDSAEMVLVALTAKKIPSCTRSARAILRRTYLSETTYLTRWRVGYASPGGVLGIDVIGDSRSMKQCAQNKSYSQQCAQNKRFVVADNYSAEKCAQNKITWCAQNSARVCTD